MSEELQDLTPTRLARRDRIVDTAEFLFTHFGFKAVTMEQVASETGMSKVTLYGYFRDKDSLFQAVADRVVERMKYAVIEALEGEGTLESRCGNAMVAKHHIVYAVVRGSPFASELFATKRSHAQMSFSDLDRLIENRLARVIRAAGQDNARTKARIVFGASNGIANRSDNEKQMARDIRLMVSGVLGHQENRVCE